MTFSWGSPNLVLFDVANFGEGFNYAVNLKNPTFTSESAIYIQSSYKKMIKTKNDLLFEQLKLIYPDATIEISDKDGHGIILKDIPFSGITIEMQGRLDLSFKNFDLVNFDALTTYLKPRLKFEECDIYYNRNINIYLKRKFSSGSRGVFEEAMWQSTVIQFFIERIKSTVNEIILK